MIDYFKRNLKNVEFQQVVVRFGFFFVVVAYIGLGNFHITSKEYKLFGLAFFIYISLNYWHVTKYPNIKNRPLVTLLFDMVAITYGIFVTGGVNSPLYVLYVWVFVSHAARFGRKNLYAASFLSVVGFTIILVYEASWQEKSFESVFLIVSLLVLPVYMDIMLRKLKRAKLEADNASKAKSIFLANMSHELRTPLNAIIGYSEMLKEEAEEEGQKNLSKDLNKINTSGQHLLSLISDILDLSRIEAGKITLELSSINVKELIKDVEETVMHLIEKRKNTFKLTYIDDPYDIISDGLKLKQVIINLLGNAAKFTWNGNIELVVERIKGINGEEVSIKVVDTGIGISVEEAEKLFSPFAQADSSTTRKYGGSGLGLSISRSYCKMLGGNLVLNSQEGVGSCFEIILPVDSKSFIESGKYIECVR